MQQFRIDTAKKFKRLPNAPVVEAVIQWIASPTQTLEQTILQGMLKDRFPGYSIEVQHELEMQAEFQTKESVGGFRHRSKWDGFRLTSSDKKHICQFKPNSVAFSRLKPYEGWENFTNSAFPFWNAFLEWASPPMVERIGIRFISQVDLVSDDLADYVEQPPSSLNRIGLSAESFFHQDTFAIPGHPFSLKLGHAIQQQEPPLVRKSLIVDIDVATTETTMLDAVESRLQEMRVLKNEVFFGFIKNAETHFS